MIVKESNGSGGSAFSMRFARVILLVIIFY